MSVIMGVDFEIDDLVSLIADVLNVLSAVLYPLLQHRQEVNIGISVISWNVLSYIGFTIIVIICYSQRSYW